MAQFSVYTPPWAVGLQGASDTIAGTRAIQLRERAQRHREKVAGEDLRLAEERLLQSQARLELQEEGFQFDRAQAVQEQEEISQLQQARGAANRFALQGAQGLDLDPESQQELATMTQLAPFIPDRSLALVMGSVGERIKARQIQTERVGVNESAKNLLESGALDDDGYAEIVEANEQGAPLDELQAALNKIRSAAASEARRLERSEALSDVFSGLLDSPEMSQMLPGPMAEALKLQLRAFKLDPSMDVGEMVEKTLDDLRMAVAEARRAESASLGKGVWNLDTLLAGEGVNGQATEQAKASWSDFMELREEGAAPEQMAEWLQENGHTLQWAPEWVKRALRDKKIEELQQALQAAEARREMQEGILSGERR